MDDSFDTKEVLKQVFLKCLNAPNVMSPDLYLYYKGLQDRKIIINSDISADILEQAIIPFEEMDQDGSGLPIHIVLQSDGGDIYSGFALVDAIERATSPVLIEIKGIAASMATWIAMAGYNKPNVKTICGPFSVGLLHSGSTAMEGSVSQLKDTWKFSERYQERIKKFVLSHSNIDEDTYDHKLNRQEFWMDSDDMLKYGIVDEIV